MKGRRGRGVETVLRKVYLAERTNGKWTATTMAERVKYGEKGGELGVHSTRERVTTEIGLKKQSIHPFTEQGAKHVMHFTHPNSMLF